jgi:hypothetical protein
MSIMERERCKEKREAATGAKQGQADAIATVWVGWWPACNLALPGYLAGQKVSITYPFPLLDSQPNLRSVSPHSGLSEPYKSHRICRPPVSLSRRLLSPESSKTAPTTAAEYSWSSELLPNEIHFFIARQEYPDRIVTLQD